MYSLRNIRHVRGLDGSGLTASIYRDGMRVGWVQVPADGGATRFTFDMEGERALFERHVECWWQTARAEVPLALTAVEFAGQDPAFTPRLLSKLSYWVDALVRAAAASRKLGAPA